jgi:hypothetical protein
VNDEITVSTRHRRFPKGNVSFRTEKGTEIDTSLRNLLFAEGIISAVVPNAVPEHIVTRKTIPRFLTALDLPDVQPWNIVPLGQGDKGKDIVWDIPSAPHLAVLGKAHSGKTNVLRNIKIHFSRYAGTRWAGNKLELGKAPDPKAYHGGYYPLDRPYCGVTVEDVLVGCRILRDKLKDLESYGYKITDFGGYDTREAFIIDNAELVFGHSFKQEDNTDEMKEMKSEIITIIDDILARGGDCGIHLIMSFGRQTIMNWDMVKKFPAIMALSNTGTRNSEILFGNREAARLTNYIKGRGIININGKTEEFQNYLLEEDYDRRIIWEG